MMHNSYSEMSSAHNCLYSVSSFQQTTPPFTSTPSTATTQPIYVPPVRPKRLSFNAREFVPSAPSPLPLPSSSSTYSQNGSFSMGGSDGQYIGQNINREENIPLPMTPPYNSLNSECHNQLLLRQQQILHEKQQLLQKQQQDLLAITLAKQQLAMTGAAAGSNPQDEIANSLKKFAYLTTNKTIETPPSPVDEVMQEFASNGYTSDEIMKYQQFHANSSMYRANHHQYKANYPSNIYPSTQQQQQQNHFNNPELNLNTIANGMNGINWLYSQQQMLYENLNACNELWRRHAFNSFPKQYSSNYSGATTTSIDAIKVDLNNKQNAKPFFKKNNFKKEISLQGKRCVFCDNNQEPEEVVKSHAVRDAQGRVLCPKLRIYTCPICNASGDNAHTVKYCPKRSIITMDDTIKAEAIRLAKLNQIQRQQPQMKV